MNESSHSNPYAYGMSVANATVDERMSFIRKTYIHLAAAAYCFVLLEYILMKVINEEVMASLFANRWMPLILMGGFIGVSWLANSWAHSQTSIGMQYAGLVLYVVAEAAIFAPLLFFAKQMSIKVPGIDASVNLLGAAGVITLVLFGIMTAIVFLTKQDFSFLRSFLLFASIASLAVILISAFMGMNLGIWFCGAMVLMACGYILYDTSNVLHHYGTHQHVAAALALFASLALLLWYVIRILMIFASSRD